MIKGCRGKFIRLVLAFCIVCAFPLGMHAGLFPRQEYGGSVSLQSVAYMDATPVPFSNQNEFRIRKTAQAFSCDPAHRNPISPKERGIEQARSLVETFRAAGPFFSLSAGSFSLFSRPPPTPLGSC